MILWLWGAFLKTIELLCGYLFIPNERGINQMLDG